MSKRKYGFFNVEGNRGEGVGMRALTSHEIFTKKFEEFKSWTFDEIESLKEELRDLRRRIDEVEGQVM